MGKPLKIERISDMFPLLWLESVITEASLMTRNIKLPSVFMNWMCFHCRSGEALPLQPKTGESAKTDFFEEVNIKIDKSTS